MEEGGRGFGEEVRMARDYRETRRILNRGELASGRKLKSGSSDIVGEGGCKYEGQKRM
jgi:hypothetical protein